MDITRLTAPTRYVPKFNNNRQDEEPFAVLIKPLVREYQLRSMEVHASIIEHAAADEASPSEKAAAARDNAGRNDAFIAEVLKVHVVGVDNLTNGGEPVGTDDVLVLMREYPKLGSEVFSAIVEVGTLTEDDAKNSG